MNDHWVVQPAIPGGVKQTAPCFIQMIKRGGIYRRVIITHNRHYVSVCNKTDVRISVYAMNENNVGPGSSAVLSLRFCHSPVDAPDFTFCRNIGALPRRRLALFSHVSAHHGLIGVNRQLSSSRQGDANVSPQSYNVFGGNVLFTVMWDSSWLYMPGHLYHRRDDCRLPASDQGYVGKPNTVSSVYAVADPDNDGRFPSCPILSRPVVTRKQYKPVVVPSEVPPGKRPVVSPRPAGMPITKVTR